MKNIELFSTLIREGLIWGACEQGVSQRQPSPTVAVAPINLAVGTTSEWFAQKKERYIPPLMITTLLLRETFKEQLKSIPLAKYILWVGEDAWPTPHLLAGVDLLQQSLFIKSPNEKLKLWTIDAALQSQGIGAVVAHCKNIRFALSQRFALEAKRSGAIGIFFLPYSSRLAPSAATSRWLIDSIPSKTESPAWKVELLKCKGSLPEKRSWNIYQWPMKTLENHRVFSLAIGIPRRDNTYPPPL